MKSFIQCLLIFKSESVNNEWELILNALGQNCETSVVIRLNEILTIDSFFNIYYQTSSQTLIILRIFESKRKITLCLELNNCRRFFLNFLRLDDDINHMRCSLVSNIIPRQRTLLALMTNHSRLMKQTTQNFLFFVSFFLALSSREEFQDKFFQNKTFEMKTKKFF